MAKLTIDVPDWLSDDQTDAWRHIFRAYVVLVVEKHKAEPDTAFDNILEQAAAETGIRDQLYEALL